MRLGSKKEDEMAATKSRATRAAEKAAQDQEPQHEAEQPGWRPEVPPEPYALVDTEAYQQTFYRPSVRVCVPGPDGESVETIETCDHDPSHGGNHWGHRDQAAAMACARRIAAARGLRIGPAKP
jgi:hypothetical protein